MILSEPDYFGWFVLAFPAPVSLRNPDGSTSGLHLDVRVGLEIVGEGPPESPARWQAATRAYQYRLLDRDLTELLVYHWQPGDRFAGPDHPHVHVSASLAARRRPNGPKQPIPLDKLHLPTGAVSLAPFVRGLIQEFRIAPRRDDWRQRLDASETMLAPAFGA